MKAREHFLLALAFVVLAAAPVSAQPEPWFHPDGTLHYYDAVSAPGGITWMSARDSAAARGGYLATIASQAENDFVFGLVDSQRYWFSRPSGRMAGPWLGGLRNPEAPAPESGWTWVSGEPFVYRNWTTGEPDNLDENALNFGEAAGARVPTWNDLSDTQSVIRGYVGELSADTAIFGLLQNDSSATAGYTLFSSMNWRSTYLIDNKGRLVHEWRSAFWPGGSCYLLEDGSLLHCNSMDNPLIHVSGGRVELLDWDSNVRWAYDCSDTLRCQHHDAIQLPNGDVVMIATELKSRDAALAAGRDPALISEGEIYADYLLEVNPGDDSVVWEWQVWDHLIQDFDSTRSNFGVVGDHPELVDLNYGGDGSLRGAADWLHCNSLDYNPQFDQLIISSRGFSEVWVVDHSTTTVEARGHVGGRQGRGGDILYRWGNPQAYRAGTAANREFYTQHTAYWIPPGLPGAGHVLVFNNGWQRPGGDYSTVEEFIPESDSSGGYARPAPGTPFGPPAPCWTYGASPRFGFDSNIMGGAQRMAGGNTLICEAITGRFFEVTRDSQIVWQYVDPVDGSLPFFRNDTTVPGLHAPTFRAIRYPADYPGLAGRDLTPGYPIERYAFVPAGVTESGPSAVPVLSVIRIQPNPFARAGSVSYTLAKCGNVSLKLYDPAGRMKLTLVNCYRRAGTYSCSFRLPASLARGIYYCRLEGDGFSAFTKLIELE